HGYPYFAFVSRRKGFGILSVMLRSALVIVVVAAGPAWAVGERVALPEATQPYAEQIRETICLSMECVASTSRTFDTKVTARLVKGHVEVRVLSPSGKVKATVTAPVHEGRISAMDLVTLTSATVKAIEAPEPRRRARHARP